MSKKTYKVFHNVIILDRANYQDYAKYKIVEANSEAEAVDYVFKKLEEGMVCHAIEL